MDIGFSRSKYDPFPLSSFSYYENIDHYRCCSKNNMYYCCYWSIIISLALGMFFYSLDVGFRLPQSLSNARIVVQVSNRSSFKSWNGRLRTIYLFGLLAKSVVFISSCKLNWAYQNFGNGLEERSNALNKGVTCLQKNWGREICCVPKKLMQLQLFTKVRS